MWYQVWALKPNHDSWNPCRQVLISGVGLYVVAGDPTALSAVPCFPTGGEAPLSMTGELGTD